MRPSEPVDDQLACAVQLRPICKEARSLGGLRGHKVLGLDRELKHLCSAELFDVCSD